MSLGHAGMVSRAMLKVTSLTRLWLMARMTGAVVLEGVAADRDCRAVVPNILGLLAWSGMVCIGERV